jgi:hypothetical protein
VISEDVHLRLRFLFVLLAFFVVTVLSYADSVPPGDPRMISGASTGTIPIYNYTFTFTINVDANGNGVSPVFGNNTGHVILYEKVQPQFGSFTTEEVGNSCVFSTYFSHCTSPTTDNGFWTFFGAPGIGFCASREHCGSGEFQIGVVGFNPGVWTFTDTLSPNPIPEPSVALLLGTGILMLSTALWFKRSVLHQS